MTRKVKNQHSKVKENLGKNNPTVIMVPEIHIIDENPPIFDLEWMDAVVDKVLTVSLQIKVVYIYILPKVNFSGPGIDELLADVNKQLSFKIRGEFNNKYRQQAMFQLMGQDFARLHFPHHEVLLKAEISKENYLFYSMIPLFSDHLI